MASDKGKVSRILVSIGQDFAQLGQLLADRDTHIIDTLIQNYEHNTTQKRKPKKDVNAPKKNLTSYLHYSNKNRDRLMAENPDLPQTQIARMLGQEWRDMSAEEKKVYVEMAEKDRKRYDTEMAKYYLTAVPAVPGVPDTPATPSSPESSPAADVVRPKKKAKKSKH